MTRIERAKAAVADALQLFEQARIAQPYAHHKVMVARWGDYAGYNRTRRHVHVRSDADGLFVRLDKRGQTKRYLRDMGDARIVNRDMGLVVFIESAPEPDPYED